MDFFEAAEKRYSYKQSYLPDAVPLEHLDAIAKAGILAPTGNNTQTVSLILLKDRDALNPLCSIASTEGLRTAPAAIALFTDSSSQKGKYNFETEDYAASAENMLLAAVALGYVSVWLDGIFFDPEIQKKCKAVLAVPETFHLRAVLPIGLPAEEGIRRDKIPAENRISYGIWGNKKAR